MLALLAIAPVVAAVLLWRANRAIRAGVQAAAMLSHRPWRPAMGTVAAIAELHAGAGSQFDGAVVDAFAAVIDERSRLPA